MTDSTSGVGARAPQPRPWTWFTYPDGRKLLASSGGAVIHCPDAPIAIDEADAAFIVRACNSHADLLSALHAILKAARGDEHGECWTIRQWLNDRDVFNDDIQGSERLIAEVCRYMITKVECR